ncbi:oxidoreductase [Aspergillus avenaceus]|uniref:Oxidoreductase n=1 Tax=Aspergillus avenaceus TaxID=36643 RepID=A0A5N6TKF0_ASPAV|nr:oxidoreductase [Aspergillus avenaceus]
MSYLSHELSRLHNKVAIITGGAGSFGTGIATKFIQEEAKVVIADLDNTAGTEIAGRLNCTFFQGDITQRAGWEKLFETAIHVYGGLDIVELAEDEFEKLVNTNMKSLYLSTSITIPYFLERRQPAVFVNIASATARRPRPMLTWYGATKAAMLNAVNSMAVEYAERQIHFNTINPAAVLTRMTKGLLSDPAVERKYLDTIPMNRLCQPADVANAACYLASEEAGFITGACLDVDGGRGV